MTIPTTISDHFSVLGEILLSTVGIKQKASFRKTKDLRGFEGEIALKFLFSLDQKSKQYLIRRERPYGENHLIGI